MYALCQSCIYSQRFGHYFKGKCVKTSDWYCTYTVYMCVVCVCTVCIAVCLSCLFIYVYIQYVCVCVRVVCVYICTCLSSPLMLYVVLAALSHPRPSAQGFPFVPNSASRFQASLSLDQINLPES